MITTSENNSFICTEDLCHDPSICYAEDHVSIKQPSHSLKSFLFDLWSHFYHFLGTDRWGETVSLQAGGSHYILKTEQIQKRWRQGRG